MFACQRYQGKNRLHCQFCGHIFVSLSLYSSEETEINQVAVLITLEKQGGKPVCVS